MADQLHDLGASGQISLESVLLLYVFLEVLSVWLFSGNPASKTF